MISDMLESCNKILQYTENMDFKHFVMTLKQLMRSSEILKLLEKLQIDYQRILKTSTTTSIGIGFVDSETELSTITLELTSASFGKSETTIYDHL